MNTEFVKELAEAKAKGEEQFFNLFNKFEPGTPEKVIIYATLGAAYKEHLPEKESKQSTATIYEIFSKYPLDVIFSAVKMLKIDLEKDPPAGLTKTTFRKMTRAGIAFISDYLRPLGISTRMSKEEKV